MLISLVLMVFVLRLHRLKRWQVDSALQASTLNITIAPLQGRRLLREMSQTRYTHKSDRVIYCSISIIFRFRESQELRHQASFEQSASDRGDCNHVVRYLTQYGLLDCNLPHTLHIKCLCFWSQWRQIFRRFPLSTR